MEIKFPSGYFPAQVSQVQVQLQKGSAHLAQLLDAIQYEQKISLNWRCFLVGGFWSIHRPTFVGEA
jgi:hypothetical protein